MDLGELQRFETSMIARTAAAELWRFPWPRRPPPDDGEVADEVQRLRGVVAAQQAQIAELAEKLRQVHAARRRVPVRTLLESVLEAVEHAAQQLEGRTIASARAEIKAALEIDGVERGLALGSPAAFPPAALSTISFEIATVPPSPLEVVLGEVHAAALWLQAALDRDYTDSARSAGEAALGSASGFAAERPGREALAGRLGPVVEALRRLAAVLPSIADPVDTLAARLAGFSEPPSAAELEAVSAALSDVARALGSTGP